jgi:hypothetical protein
MAWPYPGVQHQRQPVDEASAMKKRNFDLALIATWAMGEDPTVDPPSTVKWEDGSPATTQDYIAHLDDTFRWEGDAHDCHQKVIYPQIVGDLHFDKIAGVWALSGRDVTPTALDITDPDAPDDQLIAELYSFPMVYRAKIHRSTENESKANSVATMPKPRRSISLFWIASIERKHDWLIFASTIRSAAAFHRDEAHCTIDSRRCYRVVQSVHLYNLTSDVTPCYAACDNLTQLGFRVLHNPVGIQAVRLGIRVFIQGYQYTAIPEIRESLDKFSPIPSAGDRRRVLPVQ